jgi:tight adherence protein B
MIFLIFLLVSVVSFIVVMVTLRPSQEQKALDRRMMTIASQRIQEGGSAVSSDLEQYLKTRKTGPFGWLEEAIKEQTISRNLRLLILQANSQTTLGTLLVTCGVVALSVLFFAYVFTKIFFLAVLIGLAAGFIPIIVLRMKRSKRLKAFNAGLADAIDMMARSMRAGHSLPAAIGIVAEQSIEPTRSEFAEVSRQQNFGLPLRDALNQLLDRVPSQDLRVVATGMLVQKDTGGNLAEVLDRIGAVIRDRLRIQGEIRTHTAQGRLTGWILCLLPVVMLGLINMVNPGYSAPMFKDPTGQMILCVGVVLLIIGGLIIRQIIRGIEI